MFETAKQANIPLLSDRESKILRRYEHPAKPIFPNPVTFLREIRETRGDVAYREVCTLVLRALRKRVGTRSSHHVHFAIHGGIGTFTLDVQPAIRPGTDTLNFDGGKIHPLAA